MIFILKRYLWTILFSLVMGLQTYMAAYGFDMKCTKCSTSVKISQDQEIHLEKQGTQGPIVIFDSGLGFGISSWDRVIPAVSKFSQTITYDRIGVGASSHPKESESLYLASDAVARLRLTLQKLGVPAPYILVGHSLGGLFLQYYARNFPAEVSAVVLVDSATPNEPRVNSPFKPTNPTPQAFKDGYSKSLDLITHSPPFPNVPLIVLTADTHAEKWPHEKQWLTLQTEIAHSSKMGSQIIAKGSGHFIQEDQPQVVIDAIRSLIPEKKVKQ